ncbi:MAG: TatD family hydrolase [Desulfobacterales bacterium]
MKIFDSHCHLDDPCYDPDRPAVLQRAADAGVAAMMIVGTDLASSGKAVRLAVENSGCCCASVGVHPHDAKACSNSVLAGLRRLAQAENVRAWGEIGLDFNRMYSPQADQENWFVRQLEVARELSLALIFHERDSGGRIIDLLREHADAGLRGVIHCFSGTRAELDHYLDLGLYVGITGILTIKQRGAALRELVRTIPADRLLVETDAPYLTPTPERNHTRRNEPAFVRTVLLKLAEVRQDDPALLSETIWNNTCRLYGIEP